MIGSIFTFLVLYILVKASEGNREDVSGLMIVTLALIPAMTIVVATGILRPIGLEPWVLICMRSVLLVGVTFGLLWKFLGIPVGRSLAFSIITLLVSETPLFMIYIWPDIVS